MKKIKTNRNDCKIGETFYELSQMSMWDFSEKNEYVYCRKGKSMVGDDMFFSYRITECVKTSSNGNRFRYLNKDEITNEIKSALNIKESK